MQRNNENWKHPELIALWDDGVENRYKKMQEYCKGTPCEAAAKELRKLMDKHGNDTEATEPGGMTEYLDRLAGKITYFAYYGKMPNP